MLYLNDVIEHKKTKTRQRVIHLDYANKEIWLFDLGDKMAFPTLNELELIEMAITDGTLRPVHGAPDHSVITPSAAAITYRDNAYNCIKPLINNMDILVPKKRSELVRTRAKELQCSPQTVYQMLRNWWCNGQTQNALLPRFHGRGHAKKTVINRGRRAKFSNRPNFPITEKDRDLIHKALKSQYLKSDIMTLAACYQRVLEKSYSYVDGEGHRYLKAPGECPSMQQFRRLAKKLLPEEMVKRSRKGDAAFELNHRPKTGSLQHETYTVGDAYEIDATIADIFIVSSRNRAIIIGKPTLYLVFDRKSWLIVGFYVGLENPSWPAAMQAIKSIAEDKDQLCRRYGLPYSRDDWQPTEYIPRSSSQTGAPNCCTATVPNWQTD